MNDLLFLYTPLVQMGGAERLFVEEVRQFRSRGVACEAVTFKTVPGDLAAFGDDMPPVTVIPGSGALSKIAALRAHLRKNPARLLVAHTSPELVYVATRGTGVPYVLYRHNSPFYKGYPENKVIHSWRFARVAREARQRGGPRYEEFLRDVRLGPLARAEVEARAVATIAAVRHARAVIVLSHRSAQEMREVYGVDTLVLKACIPDALQTYQPRVGIRERLGIARDRRVILTVSRLDPIKRIDLLIAAVGALRRTHPDVVLVVVGVGADEPRLRAAAAALGPGAVIFAGPVADRDLWDFYATSDVFATPALADYNIAPYEALVLGCRVVWSTEMETDEWLLRSAALTTADPTTADFAAGIARALRAPAPQRSEMTPYLWSTRYATLSSLYEAVSRPGA